MSPHDFLFWTIGLLTALCAIMVVVTQNIVRAAAWLLFALSGTAGLFFLLGADFIGAVQIFIYVGGTLVLVVFGVMLTAQGPFINIKTSAVEWGVSVVVGLLLLGLLSGVVFFAPWEFQAEKELGSIDAATSPAGTQLGAALLGVEEATPKAKLSVQPRAAADEELRDRTRVGYLLPFEIVSVLLLVAMVGAAYLARAKRRKGGQTT